MLAITYTVECPGDLHVDVWLGASLHRDGIQLNDVGQDKPVTLIPGLHEYERGLHIPSEAQVGTYHLAAEIWLGVRGRPDKSIALNQNWSWNQPRISIY